MERLECTNTAARRLPPHTATCGTAPGAAPSSGKPPRALPSGSGKDLGFWMSMLGFEMVVTRVKVKQRRHVSGREGEGRSRNHDLGV
jgi:hypothetical protein